MVKVMYNDKIVYKVVRWMIFLGEGGISLWKEKEVLTTLVTLESTLLNSNYNLNLF